MIKLLHQLPRKNKQLIILGIDILIVMFALWVAYSLRLNELFRFEDPQGYYDTGNILWLWLIAPLIALPVFNGFGLPKVVIEYIEARAVSRIVKAVSVFTLLFGTTIFLLDDLFWVPRSVLIIQWLVTIAAIVTSRVVGQWLFTYHKQGGGFRNKYSSCKPILIYGAGTAGVQLSSALKFSDEINQIAFIDDRHDLNTSEIRGLKVFSASEIDRLIKDHDIKEILIATPSASKARISYIISELKRYPVKLRILPSMADVADGKVKIDHIRDVNINDLLGRDAVEPDPDLMKVNITNKVVMVTGAGGSIGSELCRQIIKHEPSLLILYEQSEYSLYELEKELEENSYNVHCVPVMDSVMDQQKVERVCKRFGVNTIYHAAAYKHVPLVEKNPIVGVINNVIGTWRTVQAATNTGVETFILISTDKAVRPTNVMGASKRFAELVLQGINRNHEAQGKNNRTRCIMVRFGNVLGSSGSVVPLFRKQIRDGGPISVTHKEITRYFMTIPEAAQLVIQAGAMGKGGDVFVLDMGEPVKIYNLAKNMIRLSGFEPKDDDHPNGDIEIKVTGLRPGEKLYEELLIDDNVLPTNHKLIMRAKEESIPWDKMQQHLQQLLQIKEESDPEKLRDLLLEVIRGYKPQCGIVDVVNFTSETDQDKNVA